MKTENYNSMSFRSEDSTNYDLIRENHYEEIKPIVAVYTGNYKNGKNIQPTNDNMNQYYLEYLANETIKQKSDGNMQNCCNDKPENANNLLVFQSEATSNDME